MRDERLTETLKALAAETREAGASADVRAALAEEVRKRKRPWFAGWVPALTAAALLAIGIWIGAAWRDRTTVREMAGPPSAAQPPGTWSDIESAEPVTPWYWHTGLPPAPAGQVLVMEVSPEMARQFGLPAVPGVWRAQVFVGDDGLTRAVRLVGAQRVVSKGE